MVVNFKAYPLFDAKRKTLKEKSFKVYSAKIFMRFQRKWTCTVTTGIIPTLDLVVDFSFKNTLFNMALFVKIPVIRVIRPVRKAFVAKM